MRMVRPLKRYGAPAYPTVEEIASTDLARVPARWRRLKSAVASLGTVALTLKALAQDAASVATPAPAPVTVEPTAGADVRAPAPQAAVTDVCPLLPVALAGEGRGGFGCVAMNPPVMLPEAEALEIIEKEFQKRGLALVDCPELVGVELPSKPGRKKPVMLDFGTAKGDVLVEYISHDDLPLWKKPEDRRSWSSFSVMDHRAAAEAAVAALAKRTEGSPVTIGVLYDPVVYMPKDWKAPDPPAGLSKDDQRSFWWRVRNEAGMQMARERLGRQLEGFFAHLAKTGKLPVKP